MSEFCVLILNVRRLFLHSKSRYFELLVLLVCLSLPAHAEAPVNATISANPAATNLTNGSGEAQRYIEKKLGIQNDHGLRFGVTWIGDANQLFSGGIDHPDKTTTNSLFLLSVDLDTEKLCGWKGGLFSVEFMQLNAQDTNTQAGSIQGYNSIPGPPPLNRSELYQLWYRQTLFDNKFNIRIGKTIPTLDFGNVIKPVPLGMGEPTIPVVTGLIMTPVFINPTSLGVLPGYYNTAYGVTLSFTPIKEWYLSYGIYDGNLARGEQIGLHGSPTFNGAYFQIAETGFVWLLGGNHQPGIFAAGVWQQHGPIQGPPGFSENRAAGYYLFGSQRLWYKHPGVDSSGISGYYQFGNNDSNSMIINKYAGVGLTAFGLIANRLNDSFGIGAAFSWLNPHSFNHANELMLQAYYQIQITNFIYVEPALSYVPSPGANGSKNNMSAGSLRVILLF